MNVWFFLLSSSEETMHRKIDYKRDKVYMG
jgi:hypothetical protein